MYTKIKNKKTGKITEFQTQQYDVGLYVIVDNDPSQQFNLDVKEQVFHDKIRNDKKVEVLV